MLYKEQFYAELKRHFVNLSMQRTKGHGNKQTELCMQVNSKYGFPPGMVSDIVTLRVAMEDALEVLLYAIASCILSDAAIKTYFTEQEIKKYSKYKHVVPTVKFPYTFEGIMVEIVPEEQYIGKTTVKELMKLRDAQIINYNADTQRKMTLKRGKDFEYYQITLNHKAVDKITELYRTGDYIPNTITFNIPPETDFKYENGRLTINEPVKFDLLDGYHRYVAMSNEYNLDDNFDYPMEIRVKFTNEENAKQFIYQEDQRTPLLKSDSNAMNKNDIGVKICKFIKGRIGSDIINQNGIISEPLLVKLINLLYVKHNMSYGRSKIVTIANIISDVIESVLLIKPDLLDNKWENSFTIIFFGAASQKNLTGKDLYNYANDNQNIAKGVKTEQLTLKKLNRLLAT